MIPQHLSKTNEHYSPSNVVSAARLTMGGIDLDPASCLVANQTVQADDFFDALEDGLSRRWHGRVWLNPPGGSMVLKTDDAKALGPEAAKAESARLKAERLRWGTKARIVAWWRKLTEEHRERRVTEAVFAGFTLEILRSAQGGAWPHPLDFACCFPSERLCFCGNDPTHANVIVYLGSHRDRFRQEFEIFGKVIG